MTPLTDQLEYNTEREHLIIPEYGRHIQKMINHAVAQDSKDERNRLAKAIISVMGNMHHTCVMSLIFTQAVGSAFYHVWF